MNPGDKLGHYEIVAAIGKGGMGEVYRAHDSRVGRDVAIKTSAERFGERFEREARAIAALNHPNICTLFDVGPNYLVMELVEGQTLAERIKEGPIPVEEALQFASQIAAALEAAHEKGIIHRDLKPGNVIVKEDGSVKVLDFGLAKVGPRTAASASDGDNPELSPTISMAATQAGVILGTAAYMAPEQAKGKPVDKRADIWAFGVVLFEMVTGKKLFAQEDLTETLASVVRDKPDISDAPAELHPLLLKCLEKDPRKRLRDISGVDSLLELGREKAAPRVESVASPETPRGIKSVFPWAAASAALTLALLGLAFLHFRETPPELESLSFFIDPPSGYVISNNLAAASPSPDGRLLTFLAQPEGSGGPASLWLRPMDSLEARSLPGTEGASLPFWSPDSRSVAFFADGKLKRTDVLGGTPLTLCDSPFSDGGSWNAGGVILFSSSTTGTAYAIYRVAAAGGEPVLVTTLSTPSLERHTHPQFLPDGNRFIYTVASNVDDESIEGIYTATLDSTDPPQRLVAGQGSYAAFAPDAGGGPGYLLRMQSRTLVAQPFDPTSLALIGDPVPIADGIRGDGGGTGWGSREDFAVSASGLLVYRTGQNGDGQTIQMAWISRDGKQREPVGAPGAFSGSPRLSPDGSRVALVKEVSGNRDIWLYEIERGAQSRLTFDESDETWQVWSPDGRQVAYLSLRDRKYQIYRTDVSGGGQRELLYEGQEPIRPADWSPDGKFLVYSVRRGDPVELWLLPLEGQREPVPFLTTPFSTNNARFSPDAKWIAYQSNESGVTEVYIRAFPGGPAGQWSVSVGGGTQPRWRGDGQEIVFLDSRGRLMAAGVRLLEDRVEVAPALELFESPEGGYDASPDNQRFLWLVPPSAAGGDEGDVVSPLKVISNWQALLRE